MALWRPPGWGVHSEEVEGRYRGGGDLYLKSRDSVQRIGGGGGREESEGVSSTGSWL